MGVKFGTEEGTFGPLLRAKFHLHRCNVWPLRGENPQNRPLSKLNNRHFALRAMLPVNNSLIILHYIIIHTRTHWPRYSVCSSNPHFMQCMRFGLKRSSKVGPTNLQLNYFYYCISRPHRSSSKMRPIATHGVAWSVCVCVSLCWSRS